MTIVERMETRKVNTVTLPPDLQEKVDAVLEALHTGLRWEHSEDARAALVALVERLERMERDLRLAWKVRDAYQFEKEQAERERDDMAAATSSHWSEFEHRLQRAETAEARATELEEALREIRAEGDQTDAEQPWEWTGPRMYKIAQAALRPDEE